MCVEFWRRRWPVQSWHGEYACSGLRLVQKERRYVELSVSGRLSRQSVVENTLAHWLLEAAELRTALDIQLNRVPAASSVYLQNQI